MIFRTVRALFLALLGILSVFAQTNGNQLSGKVTAANGAAAPNASVAVTNTATNETRRTLTGQDGQFSISGLTPGAYNITVEMAGFKRATQQNVTISATGNAPFTISLEAGSVAETVEFTGQSPATQTQTGEIAAGISMREIQELPVIDRNNQQLTELETGISPPMPALSLTTDPERNRYFSTNGQSANVNMFMVDSSPNWEPFRGSEIRVQPQENMQQKDIITSNYLENSGYSGGSLVSDMSRPGSDNWHGSAFDFWSGDALQTRSSFDVLTSAPPRFVYNQLGASAGGALVPQRTFLFGSYEGTFNNGDTNSLITVPTAAALGGNFTGIPGLTIYQPSSGAAGANRNIYPGNIVPSSAINPAARSIAAALPAPNLPGFADNYLATVPAVNHDEKADARADQRMGDHTSAFLRFGFSNDDAHEGSPLGSVIGAADRNRLHSYNAALDLTHDFTPRLIANAHFAYNRYDASLGLFGNSSALTGEPGFSGFTGNLSSIQISGLPAIGAPANLPENGIDNTFQWATAWNLISSKHNVKWGVDIRRIRSDGFTEGPLGNLFGANGSFLFGPGATMSSTGVAAK